MASDVLSAVIDASGGFADITVDGAVPGETLDFGLGTNNADIANAKVKFTIVSIGYSMVDGVPTKGTMIRYSYGTCKRELPYNSKKIAGTVSGTLTHGETLTQATTGATAVVIGPCGATDAYAIVHTVTGSPDNLHVWTGGTSSQTVTPTATPATITHHERVVDGDYVVRIALSSPIYDVDKNGGAGTSGTNPQVDILAGWITGANANLIMEDLVTTNNSTLDYPQCRLQWASGPGQRLTAGTMPAKAEHPFGICAVEFREVEQGITQYVTTRTVMPATENTPAYDLFVPNVAFTGAHTAGDQSTWQAIAYPLVGDENSIRDSGTSTTPSVNLHAQVHVCDKAGGYRKPIAVVDPCSTVAGAKTSGTFTAREVLNQAGGAAAVYVGLVSDEGPMVICTITGSPNDTDDWVGATSGAHFDPSGTPVAAGNDGTGVVSLTAATARANPFATLYAAQLGLRDYINTNYGTANTLDGAEAYVLRGDVLQGASAASTEMTAAKCHYVIRKDPTATDQPRFRVKNSYGNWRCKRVRVIGMTYLPATASEVNFVGALGTSDVSVYEDCTFQTESGGTSVDMIATDPAERWMTGCHYINKPNTCANKLLRECWYTNYNTYPWKYVRGCVLGCTLSNIGSAYDVGFMSQSSGAINNLILDGVIHRSAAQPFWAMNSDGGDCATFKNILIERYTSGSQQGIGISEHPLNDLDFVNLTMAGCRFIMEAYVNLSAYDKNVFIRGCSFQYLAWRSSNYSHDARHTCYDRLAHGVGCHDNHIREGADHQIFCGVNVTVGNNTTPIPEGFTDDNSVSGDGGGNGVYTPTAVSVLVNRIPAGWRQSVADVNGYPVPNTGNGAEIGAVQRNTNPTVAITAGEGSDFVVGERIQFTGTATDDVDGNLAETLSWSSTIDGTFATNESSFEYGNLSAGVHTISASVTNSFGFTGTAYAETTVLNAVFPAPEEVEKDVEYGPNGDDYTGTHECVGGGGAIPEQQSGWHYGKT